MTTSNRAVRGFRPVSNINPKTTHHALQKHDRLTRYGQRIVVAHQFGLPSFHDWKHAIGEVPQRRLRVLLRPIVESPFEIR